MRTCTCCRPCVRYDRVLVGGRSAEKAAETAAAHGAEAAASIEDAVRQADVVVTATSSEEPVIRREWLRRGAHVNAMGACFPHTRELDSDTIKDAALFVDRRESAETESGDYLIALAEGAIAEGHIRAELGEVLAGSAAGRTSDDELTIFDSLGLAIEDLFAAEYLLRRAEETGRGVKVAFAA